MTEEAAWSRCSRCRREVSEVVRAYPWLSSVCQVVAIAGEPFDGATASTSEWTGAALF